MNNNQWAVAGLIVVSLLFWRDHHKMVSKVDDLNGQVSVLEDEKSAYEDALDQANSNIEDAQSYAWSTYEEMGDALDNLETINP